MYTLYILDFNVMIETILFFNNNVLYTSKDAFNPFHYKWVWGLKIYCIQLWEITMVSTWAIKELSLTSVPWSRNDVITKILKDFLIQSGCITESLSI
jgi:hypothetical protein